MTSPIKKFTEWFNGYEYQPYKPGLYERKDAFDNFHFSYWNGKYWVMWGWTRENALKNFHQGNFPSSQQTLPFRGITDEYYKAYYQG